MRDRTTDAPAATLKTYRVGRSALYVVGMFDTGVTVFSQQVRALNLAWAAIESQLIPSGPPSRPNATDKPRKIAIVGGGFSGLTAAAGLLKKGADASITIFEQRDTLLPLQQGSDSRWLHPRIYDWPEEGSEASVAMLPLLNWTAARASDVVVQILAEWKRLALEHGQELPKLYCNARHLQIHEASGPSKLQIEWVGEPRNWVDGTAPESGGAAAVGGSDEFDFVILAIGFGLEKDDAISYWRNDPIGQPSLDRPRQTFLVSGQGDGAMIDLLRLRISQYRQDRILDEMFRSKDKLLEAIKKLYRTRLMSTSQGLFGDLERLENDPKTKEEFEQVRQDLFRRLRRDTEVILHLQVKKLSHLFDLETVRISFQNKLLVFFLYKCGGFIPSEAKETDLISQHAIHKNCIVRRHGTYRDKQLEAILSTSLYSAIKKHRGTAQPDPLSQSDKQRWPGGYFGFPGPDIAAGELPDEYKKHWRKEYLPGPTELLATAFCASLAGALRATHPKRGRLRVTLHRAVPFGDEELLQQTCNYVAIDESQGNTSAAARTFLTNSATIGLAYTCRQIVRSRRGVLRADLKETMERLNLNARSSRMSGEVGFVLAIPLLEPELPRQFTSPAPVIGVIYIDSEADGFFIDDMEILGLVSVAQEFLNGLERTEASPFDRIRNVPLSGAGTKVPPPGMVPKKERKVLELLMEIPAPRTSRRLQLNYDYSDFVPVQGLPK